MEGYCEIHPLYNPQEGPPKGFRARCLKCNWIYIRQIEKDFLKCVTEAEALRDEVVALEDKPLLERFERLISVMKGDT
jgi:hypothetical protein